MIEERKQRKIQVKGVGQYVKLDHRESEYHHHIAGAGADRSSDHPSSCQEQEKREILLWL